MAGKEEWKSVKGYPNYQVSNRGELKYLRGGKWHNKNLRPNKLGYVRVTLHKITLLDTLGWQTW